FKRACVELQVRRRAGQHGPQFLVEAGEVAQVVGMLDTDLVEAADAEEAPAMGGRRRVAHGVLLCGTADECGDLNASGSALADVMPGGRVQGRTSLPIMTFLAATGHAGDGRDPQDDRGAPRGGPGRLRDGTRALRLG